MAADKPLADLSIEQLLERNERHMAERAALLDKQLAIEAELSRRRDESTERLAEERRQLGGSKPVPRPFPDGDPAGRGPQPLI
jgi:hypothetical protein